MSDGSFTAHFFRCFSRNRERFFLARVHKRHMKCACYVELARQRALNSSTMENSIPKFSTP
jgi:hypothetical protein